jgi:hypothetical protein
MRPRTEPSTALGTGPSTALPEVIERDGRVVIVIPMQLQRRGNRKEIIIPDEPSGLSLATLAESIPMAWEAQRRVFGE